MEVERGVTGGGAEGMKNRLIAFLLTAAAAGAVFVYGVYREEIGEVLFNAAML